MEQILETITVGPLESNCYLYAPQRRENAADCVVIDPGDEAPRIIGRLRDLSLTPSCILLTHGHFDHCAALPDLAVEFPNATLALHKDDARYVGAWALHAQCECFALMDAEAYVKSRFKPFPEKIHLLEEGEKIGPFTVLHTPGHSPGSVCFYDERVKLLFSGDTLMENAYGRSDLPGGSFPELRKSLKRLLAMDGEVLVYPGHGAATNIGVEAWRLWF
jgi:glyoxylase-like metal-dependent hydrolase (beta-lactamase superfamily II)